MICATEVEGLLLFNRDFSFIKEIELKDHETGRQLYFTDGIWLDGKTCLLSTSWGLYFLDVDTQALTRALPDYNRYCAALLRIDNNRLLVAGTYGLTFWDLKKDDKGYSLMKGRALLNNFHFVCLAQDKNKGLWLGTDREGIVFVKDAEPFYRGETGRLSFRNNFV